MMALLLAALLSLGTSAFAETGGFNSACFGGLNDSQTSATLPPCESPDLLNTESNLDATAILKRKGFSEFANLTVATSPVSGSHSFIDSSGNRLDIVCQDRNCAKSTNGNAFTTFLTTAAVGVVRWSFVDQAGILYGANNKRDPIMKYDGTTRTSPAGMPAGSILELTQDRLVVGDISGNPNRVHYSSAGAYEQFTLGANPEDSYFDDIGATGDKVRGLKYTNGNLIIFKTGSITACELGDQYTSRCSVLSTNLGTTDPASIVTAGSSLYFRAQDKNYWELDKGGLRQISKKIPNLVNSQGGGLAGGENTNTQTTAADWTAGAQFPSSSWDYTTISGSIFPSSITFIDTSSSNFASGTLGDLVTTYIQGSVQLSSAPFLIYNGDFATGDVTYWSCTATGPGAACGFSGGAGYMYAGINGGAGTSSIRILNQAGDTLYTDNGVGQATCSAGTLDLGALGISSQTMKLAFYANGNGSEASLISSTFTAISSITFTCTYINDGNTIGYSPGPDNVMVNRYFSMLQSSITPTGFVSRIFDTSFSTPLGGPFTFAISSQPGSALPFAIHSSTSPNNDMWGVYTAISSGTRITQQSRYWQYRSTFTTSVGTTSPRMDAVNLQLATTGQFVTQCIQPNSSISAWGTLSCAEVTGGNGSLVFYATSAVSCATLPTDLPTSWQTSITNNATVSVATNTAIKIGWRSLLTSSTDQAQVDSCILSWNEGTVVQPSWAVYDSIKNAIYWTSTINGASTSNRLLKFDRNLEQWYPFDIPAQAPRVINNILYFGGASSGTWNTYGFTDSDAGFSINGYWKSKDFGGERPFQEKDFKTLSILAKNNGTGSMTGTWTNSIGTTGSYTISLATGTGIQYARSNYNLPKQSPQQFMNILLGNNSSTPFEVLGIGLTWTLLPWRVAP